MKSVNTAQVLDREWKNEASQCAEFADRWSRARLSALRSVVGEDSPLESEILERARCGNDELRKAVSKAVFHVSGLLASGMTRHFRRLWEPGEAVALIQAANIPCFRGEWTRPEGLESFRLLRSSCELSSEPYSCEYWKEVVDGFVTGLSDRFFFSRHRSVASGDSECLDWIYTRNESWLKFGSIPDDMTAAVAEIVEHLSRSRVRFEAAGFAERTLYYRMESSESSFCGPGKRLFEDYVKSRVGRACPGVTLFDISPRAVLKEGA